MIAAASGRKWPKVTASDREWLRVTASDRKRQHDRCNKWPQLTAGASDHKWPQETASSKIKTQPEHTLSVSFTETDGLKMFKV